MLLWLKGSKSLHPCSKTFLPSQKTRNLIDGNGIRIISSIITFVYNVQVTICCTVFYLKLDYNILCTLSIELNDSHSSAFAWLYYQSSVLLAPRSAKLCDLQQRFGERVVGSTKPVHNHNRSLLLVTALLCWSCQRWNALPTGSGWWKGRVLSVHFPWPHFPLEGFDIQISDFPSSGLLATVKHTITAEYRGKYPKCNPANIFRLA